MIEDWQQWMHEHHIRLRGEPGDSRQDEKRSGGGISGDVNMENASTTNARSPGNSHIQKHEPKR
jgi:hypothetical protein